MKIAGYNIQPVLAIPVLLAVLLLITLAAWPSSAPWPNSPWFVYLPHFILLATAVSGACFAQTRILFLSLATAATLFTLDWTSFACPDPQRSTAALLLGSLLLPPLAATLHRLQERGLFTSRGLSRALAVAGLIGLIVALPISVGFQETIISSPPPSFRTVHGWLRLPGVGLLALLVSLPFLLLKPHSESPRLGILTAMALVFIFCGLNFASSIYDPVSHRAAIVLYGTLGAMTLLLAVMETLWRHMNIDELTELPGRRPLKHHFQCLGESYILAVVDIDHFKLINDTHGHPAGDQILRYVASELRRRLRGVAYRYGGEEFVVVYERTAYEAALNDLDDLRDIVSRKEFFLRGKDRPIRKPRQLRPLTAPPASIRLTISIGAARPSAHFRTPQEVLEAADQALYQAKENGRNRVCHVA